MQQDGIFSYPGNGTFFLGAAPVFKKYFNTLKIYPKQVHAHPRRFHLDQIEGVKDRFNGKKYPVVVFNRMSDVYCINNDPEVAFDMFNSKNSLFDKTDEAAKLFQDLLGSSLLFGPND